MKIDWLSTQAQDGLLKWAAWQHNDELLFDSIGSSPEHWAWICFELKAAQDKPGWFPKGKWATIQVIEAFLTDEAMADRRMG